MGNALQWKGRQTRRVFWVTPDRFDSKPDKSSWLEMSKALRDLGWDVWILAARSDASRAGRYPAYVRYQRSIDVPFLFRIVVLLNAYRWIRQHASSADIVVVNEDGLWLLPALRLAGLRNVHLDVRTLPVSVRGLKPRLDASLFWRTPLRLFARRASSFSFITERLRAEVEKSIRWDFPQHCIWQSGVNSDMFRCPSAPRSTERPFRIFYHGSLSMERGLDLVIRGLALAPMPFRTEFVIVGDGGDRRALEELSRQLGTNDLIAFKGFVPYEDVPAEIADADVCICPLPDRLEWNVSSPLKVLEYAASRKPLILTPIPAHLDVFRDSRFVTWTRGFEPEDFRDAIIASWKRFGEPGSKIDDGEFDTFVSAFDWTAQGEKLSTYLSSRYLTPPPLELHAHGFTQ